MTTASPRKFLPLVLASQLVFALFFSGSSHAESAFVPVFVDARTEARIGAFPFDRSVTANALNAFEKLGAKGVVVKFFLDQPKGPGDEQLAQAMKKIPTVLQARCDDAEPKSNALEERFSTVAGAETNFAVSCKSGWIPLPVLQANAVDVCFIDQPVVDVAPLKERYQGRAVKTLYSCALTLANKRAPPADATGTRKVDLRKAPSIEPISLIDVLDGKANRANFAGKIVILGYEGPKAPTFETQIGKLSAHRAFMDNLLVLEQGEK